MDQFIELITKIIPVLIPLAFIPPICIFIWIRNLEKHNKEFWENIILAFVWGGSIALFLSYILEISFRNYISNEFLLIVLFAPIVEETLKPLILRVLKRNINEIEDGLIYGAIAGLGFSATENLVYGSIFWEQGIFVILSLFYIRTIGTSLLHASTTALTGYGYSQKIINKKSFRYVLPFFIFAILAHSIFNFLAFSSQTSNHIIGVVLASVFSVSMMIWVHKKIKYHDKRRIMLKKLMKADRL